MLSWKVEECGGPALSGVEGALARVLHASAMLSHSTHGNKNNLPQPAGNGPRPAGGHCPDQFFCFAARTFADPSVLSRALLSFRVSGNFCGVAGSGRGRRLCVSAEKLAGPL